MKKELEETIMKQKNTVDQINKLDRVRSDLIQEVLRLEGEIRLLQRLIAKEEKTSNAN